MKMDGEKVQRYKKPDLGSSLHGILCGFTGPVKNKLWLVEIFGKKRGGWVFIL
jgi:hypothetical protein